VPYLIVISDILRGKVELHWLAFEEYLYKSAAILLASPTGDRTILAKLRAHVNSSRALSIALRLWELSRSQSRVA
jgi:hypothetical protein